jgi:DNA-directed RNA polymerase specialized sigma24 family protein
MDSTDPTVRLSAARAQLLEIRQDPRVRGFARRVAGDPDVAEDALQSTYYAMARLEHLAGIENIKAYFYRVLLREIGRERSQLGAILVEDFTRTAEERQAAAPVSHQSSAGFEDLACISVQFGSMRQRLVARRLNLLASIPARSADPARYRTVIYAAAEQILCAGMTGESSDADGNDAFRAAFPGYFAQPGASANTLHQRFLRARGDLRALLQALGG